MLTFVLPIWSRRFVMRGIRYRSFCLILLRFQKLTQSQRVWEGVHVGGCACGRVCMWEGVHVGGCGCGGVCMWEGVHVGGCACGRVCMWEGVHVGGCACGR